ncbi:NADH dehydrogenase [Thermotomaculum hydrothermale]|uniref:NADH dehydrogenase n=1 Tax=Thermotomaculum hydrothermale TaxID=981385 RepID=A0A7R6SXY1_9BACT|nr:FAD-dependent oxidoreductase [Thermotomaculum hydrothermale]BBB32050.1 NADH dehydrogenase [Thermotomaculum hydrothermale]
MEKFDYIIVGGGPASRILNKYIHFFHKDAKTAVFREEERIVNHCGTPYIVEGEIPWEKGLIKEEIVTRWGTPIIVEKVVDGNPEEKYVLTEKGNKYYYDKLIFATGTDQIIPDIPGKDLKNILKVRKTVDLKETMKILEGINNVVVLGAGYIGLEFAVSLKNMGKNVTVIELMPHVLGGRLDDKYISMIEEHLEEKGIKLLTGKKAVKFIGKEKVEAVELEDGTKIETDAVLSAVGVRPLTDYAEKFGLKTSKNGIVVNEYFETGVKDIYAIGDCIETKHFVTGKPFPGKLGSNAGQMARILGLNFGGIKRPYEGVINATVTKVGDIAIANAGLTEKDAIDNGFEVITGYGESTCMYVNMPNHKKVYVKVIYNKENLQFIGAELIGKFNPAGFIETATQLILMKANLYDVIGYHYSSHPELTPKTSHPYFAFASEEVLKKLIKDKRIP